MPPLALRAVLPTLFTFLLAAPAVAQVELFFEDFEDAAVGYVATPADDLSDIAAGDYFGRIGPDTAPLPADKIYNNLQGSGFFAVQDTDAANSGNADNIDLDITGINIAGFQDLEFSFFVAEDEASDGEEDWENTTSLIVEFQIDGGGFTNLFAIEAEPEADGGTIFNERPLVDTDFDGNGDGAEITDTFTRFTAAIAGAGSTLDLRINLDVFDAADEDIAIDNLLVTGVSAGGNPEGDYNLDFGVDAADYTVYRDTAGRPAAGLTADGNNSGFIDPGDHTIWAENFGAANTAVATTAAPEPGALSLVVAALLGLAARGRVGSTGSAGRARPGSVGRQGDR